MVLGFAGGELLVVAVELSLLFFSLLLLLDSTGAGGSAFTLAGDLASSSAM